MHFLVVDPNVAFATLLADELERLGHQGDRVAGEREALAAAKTHCPDMAFLDMGLGVSKVANLGRTLRSLDASTRLVVIPMNGNALPEDIEALSIQGILPKPFFLPELPDRIEKALTTPLEGGGLESALEFMPEVTPSEDAEEHRTSEPAVHHLTAAPELPARPTFSPDAFGLNRGTVETLMESLSSEVGADGVILTYHDDLLTWVGRFNAEEAHALARVVVQGWKSSAEVARILGQEQLRFEQSITGGSYLLYAVSVVDAILAVPVKGTALLGLLRQNVRRVAKQIAALCLD